MATTDYLDQANLARTVGYLVAAENVITAALRGRSVTKEDAAAVRLAFVFVRKVLDALDERSAWNAVPNVAAIIAAGDALTIAEGADAALVATWHAATDAWRV